LLWFAVTRNPTAEWLARQITEAGPEGLGRAQGAFDMGTPQRDRIGIFCRGRDLVGDRGSRPMRQAGIAIEPSQTLDAARWQNGLVERLIGSARHECTDHVIVFNEEHLQRILSKYARYYNEVRTHLSLGKDASCTRPIERFGDIIAQPILGGLHDRYARI
jgi:transposase InsO family protein